MAAFEPKFTGAARCSNVDFENLTRCSHIEPLMERHAASSRNHHLAPCPESPNTRRQVQPCVEHLARL